MSLTAPFDIITGFPGWTTFFDLAYRQEQSRTAGGKTYVKDMGSPLWHLVAQSKLLSPNVLDVWRAKLKQFENGLFTFYGYPLSRTYPILYPRGTWPTGGSFSGTSAAISSINANRKAIAVSSLPAGFVLSVGDYVQIGTTDLHQVLETATASGGGVTPQFEVRPFIWTGVSSGAVSVFKPHCLMAVDPGSISTDSSISGWGSVSFSATEART